jgi:hypothetical protein
MKQIPVAAIIAAVVLALGLLVFFIVKTVKSDDTQGVSYGNQADYRKRMAEKMGGGSGGGGASTYGQGKPNAAPRGPGGSGNPQQQMMEMRARQMGGQ